MAENLDLFEDYDSSFEFEGFTAEELGEDNPRLEESLNSDIEVEEYQESEEEDDSDSDSDAENVDPDKEAERWIQHNFVDHHVKQFEGIPGPTKVLDQSKTAQDFFHLMWPKALYQYIADETNKRRKISMKASEKWAGEIPKFNTPYGKRQLEKFAKDIEEECAVPEIGFGTFGIIRHTRDHFYQEAKRRNLIQANGGKDTANLNEDIQVLLEKPCATKPKGIEGIENETVCAIPKRGEKPSTRKPTAIEVIENETLSAIPKRDDQKAYKLNLYSSEKVLKCLFQTTENVSKDTIELALKNIHSIKRSSITGARYSDLCKVLASRALNAGHILISSDADHHTLRSKDIAVLKHYVTRG